MKYKKTIATLTVLCAAAGVLVIALGVWALQKTPNPPVEKDEPTAAVTTTTTATITAAPIEPTDALTDEQKVQINTELYNRLRHGIWKSVNLNQKELQFDTNYLADAESRSAFAWEVLVDDREFHRVYEVDADGELVTGAVSFRQEDYAALYVALYGEDADLDALLRARKTFRLKEDRIYGYHVTGWGAPEFAVKTTGFSYNAVTGLYELTVDFLTAVEKRPDSNWYDVDLDKVMPYDDPAVLAYPAEAIYAKMTMEYQKIDDRYVLKSLQFTHP